MIVGIVALSFEFLALFQGLLGFWFQIDVYPKLAIAPRPLFLSSDIVQHIDEVQSRTQRLPAFASSISYSASAWVTASKVVRIESRAALYAFSASTFCLVVLLKRRTHSIINRC